MRLAERWMMFGAGVCALTALGCGGDAAATGPEAFLNDLVSAECANLYRCHGGDSAWAENRWYYGSARGCAEIEQRDLEEVARIQASIEAGTVVFDQGAADECLRAVRDTCTYTTDAELACERVFLGQLAAGSGCAADRECESGLCSGSGFSCGMCRALVSPGGTCGSSEVCARGPNGEEAYCDFDDRCALFEPYSLTADIGLGELCDYEQFCEPGLYCDGEVCVRSRDIGEPCDPYLDSCVTSGFCVPSVDDPDVGVCLRARVETRVGEPCGPLNTEYVACDLTSALYCTDSEAGGVCALYPSDGTDGDFCVVPQECAEGFECGANRCTATTRLADGEECTSSEQCASGFCEYTFEVSTCRSATYCL